MPKVVPETSHVGPYTITRKPREGKIAWSFVVTGPHVDVKLEYWVYGQAVMTATALSSVFGAMK